MEFKSGQKVKILSSRSDDIDDIDDMIGGVFVIEGVNSVNYLINGWYFDPDEIEAFEEVQETKPSMFQMQGFNPEAAGMFLDYSMSTNQQDGLCNSLPTSIVGDFLYSQEPFKNSIEFPVEYAIQKKNEKSTKSHALCRLYFKDGYAVKNMVNRNRESYRLRIWWAYNLAVKLSQDPDALSKFK